MSSKKIKIAYRPAFDIGEGERVPDTYEVVFVKNSTSYLPGQVLQKEEVDRLCGASVWDVTLVRAHDREAQS